MDIIDIIKLAIIVHCCIIVLNTIMLACLIHEEDGRDITPKKDNTSIFFTVFFPITNIFGLTMLVFMLGDIYLTKYIEWLNK